MQDDIKGKVAIVTGAGRGIGRGIAIAYGQAGLKVVVASRSQSTVDSVVAEIKGAGGTAIGITCDVGKREAVFAMVKKTVDAYGTVDVLVNNAQTTSKPDRASGPQPLATCDEEEWELIYRTGVLSTLWAMKAVYPIMKDRGGKIINFGSITGQLGMEGYGAYNTTKEGIRALTRTAAREWAKLKINVNVVNPAIKSDGLINLEKNHPEMMAQNLSAVPMGYFGDPVKDAGGLAIFLASSQSDYLTGMTFMLDGGMYMSA